MKKAEMPTRIATTFPHATAGESAPAARSDRSRIRLIAFWATTLVIVFELIAGSVWNLLTIEWIEIQLRHLGYPHFFAYVLGAWQVGAAVVIIAPRLPLIKEWAYAGAFFLWSGAVASHLAVGDSLESWVVPPMFAPPRVGRCDRASRCSVRRFVPHAARGRRRRAQERR
ncbi:DoxX family protein [Nocardia sp. NPDC051787]|uniref:DoxX family protein n=1 Tax=Nocardia sp. NPDC051787 TaxID=3155415 RepID=UPI00342132DB